MIGMAPSSLACCTCWPLPRMGFSVPLRFSIPSTIYARDPCLRYPSSISLHATSKRVMRAIRNSADPDSTEASVPVQVKEKEVEQRLFSSVNQATMEHQPGGLTTSVLLVAGTSVGAGILAIPAVTEDAGFLASSVTCALCWMYMVGSGLLIAEVNVNTLFELGSEGVSMVTMASRTLGINGVRFVSAAYLLIHYALLVAYVARSADIISTTIGSPLWLSGVIFSGTLGCLCYFGSQRVIGVINGALVVSILASFGILVAVASGGIDFTLLLRANFEAVPHSVPIIALSFVYQNVVPVVCTNLEGNLPRIRNAIVLGTAIPLVMFLIWDAVILGSLTGDISHTDPLARLREMSGIVGPVVEVFSLLAVATSYIGFTLGLSDFLCDLLKLPVGRGKEPLSYLLTVLPPLVLAFTSRDIFFTALDVAGTYGVMTLFGIIPAAMAWSQRYSGSGYSFPAVAPPLVPGGRVTLTAFIGVAGVVVAFEFLTRTFNIM